MTDLKGSSQFCFPKTLNVPQGKAVVEGSQTYCGLSHYCKCFVIPPNSKIEKKCEEIVCFNLACSQICHGSKEPDLIQVVVSLRS